MDEKKDPEIRDEEFNYWRDQEITENLLKAAEDCDFQHLSKLLRHADYEIGNDFLNRPDMHLEGILIHPVKKNNIEIVKLLLNSELTRGLDIGLSIAIQYGKLEIAKLLIDHGAYNSLDFAIAKNQKNMVKLLIQYYKSKKYLINGLVEAARVNDENLLNMFLEEGADPTAGGNLALRVASENGNLDIIKKLVEKGADIHAQNEEALYLASSNRHTEVVKYLLENGADVHAEDERALLNSGGESMRLLINAGADVEQYGEELLIEAAKNNRVKSIEVLLEAGVDPNVDTGLPLIECIRNSYMDSIKVLVEKGADLSIINELTGYTPLGCAAFYKKPYIIKYLLEKGANPLQEDSRALGIAVSEFDEESVKILLNAGSQVSERLYEFSKRIAGGNIPDLIEKAYLSESRRRALEQEQKNEEKRKAYIEELKNSENKPSENPFIEQNCASTNSLMGDSLKDTDDIVVFELEDRKGDCYLKDELKMLQSAYYIRGVGEKAFKLPWSNVWISKSLKESVENMEGFGPVKLVKSQDYVGYDTNNILYVLSEN